jgi:uncharacterized protein YerC
MAQVSRRPLGQKLENELSRLLIRVVVDLKNPDEIENFLKDFLSPMEKIMLAKRLAIAVLIGKGHDYQQIKEILKVTAGTIASVSLKYKYAGQGYKRIVEKILRQEKTEKLLDKIDDLLSSLPPKGGNWSKWRRQKEQVKLARQKIL